MKLRAGMRTDVCRRLTAAAAAIATLATGAIAVAPQAAAAPAVTLVPNRIIGFSAHAGLYGWGATTMRDGSVLIGDYWNQRVRALRDRRHVPRRVHPERRVPADPAPIAVRPRGRSRQRRRLHGRHRPPPGRPVLRDRRLPEQLRGQNGVSGNTPGKFQYPSRVAVRNGYVYISDTWANRIVVYTPDRHRRGVVRSGRRGPPTASSSNPARSTSTRTVCSTSPITATSGSRSSASTRPRRSSFVRKFGSKYNAAIAVAARRRGDPR